MVIEGRCTVRAAAELVQLSERQVLRLKKGFREQGPSALAHGNRGRQPKHALGEDLRREVIELATSLYYDYNHTHLREMLAEEHDIQVSRRSVTRILTSAGLRSPRKRRARKHRSRRERMTQEGMLLQVDGSTHDWLEGRGPKLTLVGAVDDATGEPVHAVFREQEDSAGYLLVLRDSIRRKGVPLAWYSDRHGIFQRNGKEPWTLAEELAGRRQPTQVGRALEELGVNLILANSPQAKGRVERLWETFQDRLVKELRRASACSLADANRVLKTFLPRFRKRFARKAADPKPAYRPLPPGVDLAAVCSFHYFRRVANDNTVRLEERLVQIPPGPGGRSYAGCRVQMQERLDGSLAVVHKGRIVARQKAASASPLRARHTRNGRSSENHIPPPEQRTPTKPASSIRATRKPPANHPWRMLVLSTASSRSDKFTGQLT